MPDTVRAWVDTGFTIRMPKRASRGRPLTAAEKTKNQPISRKRILAEHAIGGIKRFRGVTDVFRNHADAFADRLILVSAGLWNLHLAQG